MLAESSQLVGLRSPISAKLDTSMRQGLQLSTTTFRDRAIVLVTYAISVVYNGHEKRSPAINYIM